MAEQSDGRPVDPRAAEAASEDVKAQMERIYGGLVVPVADIPWNRREPPALLVDLVDAGRVAPCRAIDMGCGAGNYAIYLARRGFRMTGVDLSSKAIELARLRAQQQGVACEFVAADLLGPLEQVKPPFDFAYDFELLHHLYPDQRPRYVANVSRLLSPQAKYLSVCFSEEDPQFGGSGKYRRTSLGTLLYFSSAGELRALFSRHFAILDLRTVEITAVSGTHVVIYALMQQGSTG